MKDNNQIVESLKALQNHLAPREGECECDSSVGYQCEGCAMASILGDAIQRIPQTMEESQFQDMPEWAMEAYQNFAIFHAIVQKFVHQPHLDTLQVWQGVAQELLRIVKEQAEALVAGKMELPARVALPPVGDIEGSKSRLVRSSDLGYPDHDHDAQPTYTGHLFRKTGRTTRMLKHAMKEHRSGKKVVVVAKDQDHKNHLIRHLLELGHDCTEDTSGPISLVQRDKIRVLTCGRDGISNQGDPFPHSLYAHGYEILRDHYTLEKGYECMFQQWLEFTDVANYPVIADEIFEGEYGIDPPGDKKSYF